MEILVRQGSITQIETELVVVNLFEGVTQPDGATQAVDIALNGAISDIIAAGDLRGRMGESTIIYTRGALPAKRVMVTGLGPRAAFTAEVARRVAGSIARAVRDLGITGFASIVHGAGGLDPEKAAQALVEGSVLGSYRFDEHRTSQDDQRPDVTNLTVVELDEDAFSAIQTGARTGQVISESTCFARDLINQPGNYCTPTLLADYAETMANETGLSCDILEEADMADLGMGALLGVAQGTQEAAKFIILQHNADRSDLPTYVIVGKGITFDSGGISLKPSQGMEAMKTDMSGAAATLGVLRAAALLDIPLRVVGLVPASENLPGARAYKPGDVLTSLKGTTIEVISTDAEGRLLLADALSYAERFNPRATVDIATLTGSCVVALGHVACGLLGTDDGLIAELKEASEITGELLWPLPLFDEYKEQIKSDVADIKNSGGRPAGAITAGHFLAHFAQAYPWAHLDIAGMMGAEKTSGYIPKGAIGFGTRLLVQWLRRLADVTSN